MAHTTSQCLTNSQLAAPRMAASPRPGDGQPGLLALLREWRQRARERRDLARLGERELHDIGLSRSLVFNEINKPFWRP